MPFTLIPDFFPNTPPDNLEDEKERLDAFALNLPDPHPTLYANELYTKFYFYLARPSTEAEDKENVEQENLKCKLLYVRLTGHPANRRKHLDILFHSEIDAKQFLQAYRNTNLACATERNPYENEYSIRFVSNHFTPEAFKKFKSFLVSYFDLDAESVDNMLYMAGSEEVETIRQNRVTKISDLKFRLESLKCTNSETQDEEESKSTREQIVNTNLLTQTLLAEAEAFDKNENLGRNTVTLVLGEHFLSCRLHEDALSAFKQIQDTSSPEYSQAQSQLAHFYLLQKPTCSSLDDGDEITQSKKGFKASLKAHEYRLASISANTLCGYNTIDAFLTSNDFEKMNLTDASIYDYQKYNRQFMLKLFEEIRKKNQLVSTLQEENRVLTARLDAVKTHSVTTTSTSTTLSSGSSSSSSHAAPESSDQATPVVIHAFEASQTTPSVPRAKHWRRNSF